MTWIIGWGTYTNMKNIKKIKENIKVLPRSKHLARKANIGINPLSQFDYESSKRT